MIFGIYQKEDLCKSPFIYHSYAPVVSGSEFIRGF